MPVDLVVGTSTERYKRMTFKSPLGPEKTKMANVCGNSMGSLLVRGKVLWMVVVCLCVCNKKSRTLVPQPAEHYCLFFPHKSKVLIENKLENACSGSLKS